MAQITGNLQRIRNGQRTYAITPASLASLSNIC